MCLRVFFCSRGTVAQLVNDFGVPIGDADSGGDVIDAAEIFAFVNPALEHRTASVRKAACDVYVNCHKFIGGQASELLEETLKDSVRKALAKAVPPLFSVDQPGPCCLHSSILHELTGIHPMCSGIICEHTSPWDFRTGIDCDLPYVLRVSVSTF
eukprot:COSAG05_NODE_2830_length_2592_cov_47.594063_3_plen_155_part_00